MSSHLTMFSTLILFLSGVTLSWCQLPKVGTCPQRTPLKNVDIRKLSGHLWYELQRTPSLKEWPLRCIAIRVKPFYEAKSELKITSISRLNDTLQKYILPLRSLDPEGRNGKLTAEYGKTNITLQLLAYDEQTQNWGIVWSCRDFGKIHTESVWVISKERSASDDVESQIHDSLLQLNLEHLVMKDSMQTECELEDNMQNPL